MNDETRLKALGYKVLKDNTGDKSVIVALKGRDAIITLGYNYRKIRFKWKMNTICSDDINFISCYNTPDIYHIRLCSDHKDGCWSIEKELLYIKKDYLLVTRDSVADKGDFLLYKNKWSDGRVDDWIYDIKRSTVYVIKREVLRREFYSKYYDILMENGILKVGINNLWQDIIDYEEREDLAYIFVMHGEEL